MIKVDRRSLLTSGAAATLLAATGTSLAQTPQSGGHLRIALAPYTDVLPSVARAAMFDSLTEIGADGVLKGELASAWKSNHDARVWTLTLRSDVRFHDGEPVNATDVAASLVAQDLRAARVSAVDNDTLWIELDQPDPNLPYLLADEQFMIFREAQLNDPLETRQGTGLYEFQQHRPARHFLGTRVAHHYKDGVAGWADQIETVMIPDAGIRSEALRDGFVDIAELPYADALSDASDITFHNSVEHGLLAAQCGVGRPREVGTITALDNGRIAERWWLT